MPKIDALGDSSSEQKGALSHQAIEDYLKTIYKLSRIESPVSTSRLADARQVKPASVTGMVKRLAKLRLVDYKKHGGVSLTESGEKIALEVIRHHRLLETYLIEALGFTWDEVHEQADILEHVISEQLEDRIAAALDFPRFDPHGAPIPTKDGQMPQQDTTPLTQLHTGAEGKVARIWADDDPEILRYLAKLGLVPGTKIKVIELAPFDGPISIEISGANCVVGYNVARSVLVQVDEID